MRWHNCPEDLRAFSQVCGPAKFRKLLRNLQRPQPDVQLEWHLRLFNQYTKLKRGLERRDHTARLSDDDLRRLKIIRGAPLDIDDIRPIDIEKRFFVPALPKWVSWFIRQFLKRPDRWSQPLEEAGSWKLPGEERISDIHKNHYAIVLCKMTEWYDKKRGEWRTNPWWSSRGMDKDPTQAAIHGEYQIGAPENSHEFARKSCLAYKSLNGYGFHPSFPHLMIMTSDSVVPDDRLLRSELLLAVNTLRGHLASRPWIGHHTIPILVLSFHETGARILQMHAENNHFVVRASRLLEFKTEDGTIPQDGRIMLSWMLASPIGDTRFFPLSDKMQESMELRQDERHSKQASVLKIPAIVVPDLRSPDV